MGLNVKILWLASSVPVPGATMGLDVNLMSTSALQILASMVELVRMGSMSTSVSANLAMKENGARPRRTSAKATPVSTEASADLTSIPTPANAQRDILGRTARPILTTANTIPAGMEALVLTM